MKDTTVKFKSKGRLAVGIAAALLVLALAIVNRSAFMKGESVDPAAVVKFMSVYALGAALLVLDIKLSEPLGSIVSGLVFLAGPVLCFETVRTLVSAPVYDFDIYFDNIVFYAVVQLAVFALTQSVRVSLITEILLSYALHTANQLVLLLRGTPLVPTDLYAIDTAMAVTNVREWRFDLPLLLGTAAFTALAALSFKLKISYKRVWMRITAALVSAALTVGLCVYIYQIDYKSYSTSTFDTESTNNVNGVALSFYINARKMKLEKPVGYSVEAIESFLKNYEDDPENPTEDMPNIIVIMNESFSDLSYMGRFKTSTPYMPYYNELIKDYPHGRLLVSVLGGGTCNTEFEFLTSLSMMNMPNSCYAYMQHIKGEVPSLASYLKGYGYRSLAMHPFYEVCWKRNSVYKFMGFDDFISGEDMTTQKTIYQSADRWEKGFGDDVEYVRTLISDSFFYDRVIEQFENKGDSKLFIFGVTVQNHSGYEYSGDDFTADVHVEKVNGYFPRTEQYLSLMKKSDEALKELIEYFEKVDEKTLIVFFGDHQPNVEIGFLNEIAPNRNITVNGFLTRYETPFVIWANYDIGGKKDLGIVSPNFLGIKTLEYANVPLSKEYKMILDMQDTYPAMNTWGYFDRFNCWNERKDSYSDEAINIYNFYTYYTLTKR